MVNKCWSLMKEYPGNTQCGGYCRHFANSTLSHTMTTNEKTVISAAAFGILLGANDREKILSPPRFIAIARGIMFPVVTSGYVFVCCEALKEHVAAKRVLLG